MVPHDLSLCNLFLASPLVFSLSPSLSTRAVYHSRVNETTKLTRSFHIVVYTVDRIRSKSNPEICSRSVVGDFSSSQPFLLFYPPFLRVYIYIHIDSRYHWFEVVGASVDITETRREEFEIGPPTCHKPGPVTIHHGYLGIIDLYRRLEFLLETEPRRHRALEMSEKL